MNLQDMYQQTKYFCKKHNQTLMTSINKIFFALSLLLTACVAAVGPSIEVPSIPEPRETNDIFPVLVEVGDFQDIRLVDQASKRVSPEGNVSALVKQSFTTYLEKRGATVEPASPVKINGELRSWEAEVQGTSTGMLNSTASIYVEVRDSSNNKIYSGVFQGTRASQFPLVTKSDIQDSLAFALVQAIDQALNDSSFRKSLTNK